MPEFINVDGDTYVLSNLKYASAREGVPEYYPYCLVMLNDEIVKNCATASVEGDWCDVYILPEDNKFAGDIARHYGDVKIYVKEEWLTYA